MKHPILGEMTRDDALDEGVATISYKNRDIEVCIAPDELPWDATVDVAAAVVQELANLDAKAKQVAASELTETYNSGWSEYDEAQDDGTLKSVSKPNLTQAEFMQKLTLDAVNVTGNMVALFYGNENMFLGHSVIVTSMDGAAFTDTHAEIFG